MDNSNTIGSVIVDSDGCYIPPNGECISSGPCIHYNEETPPLTPEQIYNYAVTRNPKCNTAHTMNLWVFMDIDLTSLDVCNRNLSNVKFHNCNLRCATFDGCDLTNAEFINCNLQHASFNGARLNGTNFEQSCYFIDCDFTGATFDNHTTLPDGISFSEYCKYVVPALLTYGSKPLRDTIQAIRRNGGWGNCTTWTNCPLREAYHVVSVNDLPLLIRDHAMQFIILYDCGLIPEPNID